MTDKKLLKIAERCANRPATTPEARAKLAAKADAFRAMAVMVAMGAF